MALRNRIATSESLYHANCKRHAIPTRLIGRTFTSVYLTLLIENHVGIVLVCHRWHLGHSGVVVGGVLSVAFLVLEDFATESGARLTLHAIARLVWPCYSQKQVVWSQQTRFFRPQSLFGQPLSFFSLKRELPQPRKPTCVDVVNVSS
eukprot:1641924-Amphidinium_carterae.1